MKIGMICSEYPPGPHGGIGMVTQVLARGLVARGHEVRVIGAYPPHYPGADREDDQGVSVWRLRESRGPGGWLRDRIALFRTVARWSRHGAIDLVEVPDWGGPAAFWPRLTVPVIGRVHGSASYYAAEMHRPIAPLTRWLERRSLGRVDGWSSVSRYAAERTREIFGLRRQPDAILDNPVTVPIEPRRTRPEGHRVVFTGTLAAKKGVISLIRAWASVRAAGPDAELHLLGKDGRTDDGESMQQFLRAQLDARTMASVFFHGHVGRQELLQHLRNAQVAVFPSYSETFGLAPVEAMACGCPTIYSRRGPGPELVRDEVDGLLVDPDQPPAIAQAVLRILTDADLAARLSEAGPRRVRERFALESVIPANEQFYERCRAAFHGWDPVPRLERLDGWRKPAAGGAALGDCGLVVPTYRRPATMLNLLQHLETLPDPPAEAVIVDGSPDPLTGDALAAWAWDRDLPFDLVYVRSPAGLTRQRNVGIDLSTRDLVFFLDDDCWPHPGYFEAIRAVFAADRAQTIGAVRGFITNGTTLPVPWLWRLRAQLGIVGEPVAGRYYPTGMTWTWNQVAPFPGTRPIDVLAGGAAAYRRAVFARHRFSEFFRGYSAGEDVEMSRRIASHWSLVVCGDALVDHRHATAARPGGFAFGWMAIRNRVFVWRRHSPDAGWGVRFRFWLDQALGGGADLARFCRSPWRVAPLLRLLGTIGGGLACWVAPPRYTEPPARRQFDFQIDQLSPATKTPCQSLSIP